MRRSSQVSICSLCSFPFKHRWIVVGKLESHFAGCVLKRCRHLSKWKRRRSRLMQAIRSLHSAETPLPLQTYWFQRCTVDGSWFVLLPQGLSTVLIWQPWGEDALQVIEKTLKVRHQRVHVLCLSNESRKNRRSPPLTALERLKLVDICLRQISAQVSMSVAS